VNEWVLCVDDEPETLVAHRRFLTPRFNVETAADAAEAIAILAERGSFAVIVSDLQLPGMSGIELLAEARRGHPDTVRLLVTGRADLESAITAVNDGHVFRFLTKPCAPNTLAAAVLAGIEQHRLITAQKDLLANTLRACVHVLGELLAITCPPAFGRSLRVQQLVRELTAQTGRSDDWELDVAAMLSQLGCVVLSDEVLEKIDRGEDLSEAERDAVFRHPAVGAKLLRAIPRLERIAAIIAHQNYDHATLVRKGVDPDLSEIASAAGLLKVSLDFDALVQRGELKQAALATMRARAGCYHPAALTALAKLVGREPGCVQEITVEKLEVGMLVVQDLIGTSGHLLLKGGLRVTESIKLRLQTIASHGGLVSSVAVLASDSA
jgi:response regulator RpfG family c-di-GMP phosphodiesterase